MRTYFIQYIKWNSDAKQYTTCPLSFTSKESAIQWLKNSNINYDTYNTWSEE